MAAMNDERFVIVIVIVIAVIIPFAFNNVKGVLIVRRVVIWGGRC